jgi:carotenoid cleavage dioxygenase-like enzyme
VNASPPQGIVKMDLQKGTEDSWIGDADQYLSEPLFAKKKGAGKNIFHLFRL